MAEPLQWGRLDAATRAAGRAALPAEADLYVYASPRGSTWLGATEALKGIVTRLPRTSSPGPASTDCDGGRWQYSHAHDLVAASPQPTPALLELRYLTTASRLPRHVATFLGRGDTAVKYLNSSMHRPRAFVAEPSRLYVDRDLERCVF